MENITNRAKRKVLTGVVKSDKMNKTRTVEVTTTKKHAFYGKIIRTSKCYHAHDEGNESKIGRSRRKSRIEVIHFQREKALGSNCPLTLFYGFNSPS